MLLLPLLQTAATTAAAATAAATSATAAADTAAAAATVAAASLRGQATHQIWHLCSLMHVASIVLFQQPPSTQLSSQA